MSRRAAAVANLAGTSVNTVIISIQGIVLMPAYLHVLPIALFGAWIAASDLLNLMQVFDFGLTNVVTQRIGAAHAKGDQSEIGVWFGSGAVALAIMAAGLGTLSLGASYVAPHLMKVYGGDAVELTRCLQVCVLAIALYLAHLPALALARGTQDTVIVNFGTVVGSLVGFAIAVWTLRIGLGLWSAAYSVIARVVTVIVFDLAFVAKAIVQGKLRAISCRHGVLGELASLAPATAGSGMAYLLASQTEGTMVAMMLGPELVPILTFTRRAADVAGGLLSALSYSSYAGFAHLVASDQKDRSLVVYSEISSLWMSLAIACSAAYLAVNTSLVSVWVGFSHYGGFTLSCLMALQLVVTGQAQLRYYLFRATGAIMEGSLIQLWESLLRFPLMIGLLFVFKLPGLAIGSVIAAGACSAIAYKDTRELLRTFATPAISNLSLVWCLRVAVLMVGGCIGWLVVSPSWIYVVTMGFAVALTGAALLVIADSQQSPIHDRFRGMIRWRVSA